jgi:glycosyltransferase involved in cell wall biosynthesis
MTRLSVVIVNRDEPLCEFTARRVLETADVPVEVIVVDDGSRKRPKLPDGVRLIEIPTTGLAFARHVGITSAKNEAILLLDAHCNFHNAGPHSRWASKTVEWLDHEPRGIACYTSVQLDSDPRNSVAEQMDMQTRTHWTDGGKVRRPRTAYHGAGGRSRQSGTGNMQTTLPTDRLR